MATAGKISDYVGVIEILKGIFTYKGCKFQCAAATPEGIDALEDMETNDDDVFLITYPKSGTIFIQQVVSLILNEGHRHRKENIVNIDRAPWIEYNIKKRDLKNIPSPRLFSSHLPYHLVPRGLRNKRGKVIYIVRNPKDVMVSFYYFEFICKSLIPSPNFEHFMEKFLKGEVFGGCWFDNVTGWCAHKENFNCLLIQFEDMVKDLRSVVLKICQFLGKDLDDQEVDLVVEQATFKNMRSDPNANYETLPNEFINKELGRMLRKGTIGDWKNVMTVAQNERFEQVCREKLEKLPIKFIWDLNEGK
ncbi:amine sulfotransferase-like [Ambystoma mexicanum]|uniref:amine sulfotransferase-like n=1 Tax=Ambystoma mexicanum TaxID=8296 RepID=UPI0037E8DA2D